MLLGIGGKDEQVVEGGFGDPFAAAVRASRMSMILTDPHQRDNPIVFTNDAFLALTGYTSAEVLGHNCRFLQGLKTDLLAVRAIQKAVAERREIAVDILNYRKDGAPFWNGLFISPVFDGAGELRHYFAAQLDIGDRVEAQHLVASQQEGLEREVARRTDELRDALETQTMLVHEVDHRVKNNIQMISALIGMQAMSIGDLQARAAMSSLLQRVEAMGTVHRRLYQAEDVRQFDLADFTRDIVHDLMKSSGRDDIKVRLDLESVRIPSQLASPHALMLNELIVNALKHAFPAGRPGRLAVAIARDEEAGQLRLTVADDGAGMAEAGRGFGTRLIRTLARQLAAEITWRTADPGTIVELRSPLRHPERGGFDG